MVRCSSTVRAGPVSSCGTHHYKTSVRLSFFVVANNRGPRGLHYSGFREMLLHRADQRRESIGVVHGHVRKDLAVQIDAASLQRVNQLAVGGAVIARGGADALNPERAVIAFAHAAVAIGVAQRAVHRFFRRAVELALGKEKSLGVLQQLFAAGAAFGSTFNSRHGSLLLWRVSKALAKNSFQVRRQTRPSCSRKCTSSRTGLSRGTAFCSTTSRHC